MAKVSFPSITSYLKMGNCAALQDWYWTRERNASTCQREEKRRGWMQWPQALCPAVCHGGVVLPEVFLGKQLPRSPLHFSRLYCKLVTRMRPQSIFTIPAVPAPYLHQGVWNDILAVRDKKLSEAWRYASLMHCLGAAGQLVLYTLLFRDEKCHVVPMAFQI